MAKHWCSKFLPGTITKLACVRCGRIEERHGSTDSANSSTSDSNRAVSTTVQKGFVK